MGRLTKEEQSGRFEIAKKIAKFKGGKILSQQYRGVDAKYRWRCKAGHEWEASYYCVVTRGQWCGKCSGRTTDRNAIYERALATAKKHGGYCLVDHYRTSHTQMRWKCARGHEWEATYSNISRGKWCPWCAGNKVDPEEQMKRARSYAFEQGGECLSTSYPGNKAPMRWRCAHGHEWHPAFNTVVNRQTWCGKCRGSIREANEQLAIAKKAAAAKGGECINPQYINNSTPLRWRCNRGHEWEAVFYAVVQAGSWCPVCSVGLRERLTRHVLEELFGAPFKKARPEWLINPETGRRLELDGFNKKLSLAFEYQGEQLFRLVQTFKMDSAKFAKRQCIDVLKRKLCEQHGVALLEISHEIEANDLPRWIHEAVSKLPEAHRFDRFIKPWRTVHVHEWLESDSCSIEDLRRHAMNRGGLCLSNTYAGVFAKYVWQCELGHQWVATWDRINNGNTWCPDCAGKVVDPVQRLALAKSVAKKRGGECLSHKYEGSDKKMRWRCAKGHEWEVRYYNVVNGISWCPVCREPHSEKK